MQETTSGRGDPVGSANPTRSKAKQGAFDRGPREQNREADRLANQGVDEWLSGEGKDHARAEPSPELFD